MKVNQQITHLKEAATQNREPRYIAISSGKGGVGKTLFSINIGKLLSEQGKRVLIIDGDFGLSNVHLMLGIAPEKNLYNVIKGEATLDEIIIKVSERMAFISSGSGVRELANLPERQILNLISRIKEISESDYDVVIFDTPPGIHEDTLTIVSAVDIPIIITTPEPTAVADAYALIKVANKENKVKEFYLIINKVSSPEEGKRIFKSLEVLTQKFTEANLHLMGFVKYNKNIIKGIINQKPFQEDMLRDLELTLTKLPVKYSIRKVNFWSKLISMLLRR